MAKRKTVQSYREFCFSCLDWNQVKCIETALLVLPAPLSGTNISEGIDQELRMICGGSYFPDAGLIKSIVNAEKDGRVIFGWSPWRSKSKTLNWVTWDAFILKWCSRSPALEARPRAYQLDHLCLELKALESKGILKVVGNYPINSLKPKVAAPSKPRRKKKKGSLDTSRTSDADESANDDDEES